MKKIIKICSAVFAVLVCFGFVCDILSAKKNKTKSRHKPYGVYEKYFKRPLDIVLSSFAIVVLSPIYIAVAAFVRIKLGSPVIFCQNRPGKNGNIFKIFKFRSMNDAKDLNGNLLPDEERLTGFGKTLRSSSLDELPELFNILKGDMSLVGPRPLLIKYLPYYNEEESRRHDVRPGLTGLAQINGRSLLSWEDKFGYDIEYVDNCTFKTDVDIILKTFGKVLKRSDIRSGAEQINLDFDEYRIAQKRGESGGFND